MTLCELPQLPEPRIAHLSNEEWDQVILSAPHTKKFDYKQPGYPTIDNLIFFFTNIYYDIFLLYHYE